MRSFILLALCVAASGCAMEAGGDESAGAASDQDVATTKSELSQLAEGLYKTAGSNKVYAVYNRTTAGQPGFYCWVIDPGEVDALRAVNGAHPISIGPGSNWNQIITTTMDQIAYRRYGNSDSFCPWPSGMLVKGNAVYAILGATYASEGTSCHILTNEQVDHHGGWNVVWHPSQPDSALNFQLGSAFTGECTW